MRWQDNFVGALLLRQQTFSALRERSDVFLQGFIVLFVAAIVAGAFSSLLVPIQTLAPVATKEQVLAEANSVFESRFNGPPSIRAQVQPYVGEIASMIYELETLSPRAGEGARPIAAVINYVGAVLAVPFSWAWIGWTLFAGLLIHFTSRLLGGRAGMAQMLGLTSLAAAPQIFTALTGLLALFGVLSQINLFSGLNSLLGFALAIWSAVVYIKATSVAQGFSYARAIGAIALGFGLLLGLFFLALVLFGLVVAVLVVPLAGQIQ